MSSDSSWQKITLKEAGITLIDCDHKTPKAQESGYPYIAIPQLKDGHVKLDGSERRISAEDFQQWTKKLLPQENDVIVVRRCNSGQSAHVPKNVKWAIGQNLVVLRADGEKVYPPFLRWLLRGDEWWEQVRKYINVGAVFDSLKCREIPLFELTIPPMKEQIEFAQILNSIDDRIALLRETNATLEAIAQALFKSWFVDFDPVLYNSSANAGTQTPSLPAEIQALFPSRLVESPQGLIPEGWEWGQLKDIASVVMGLSPKGESYNSDGAGVPLINGPVEFGEYFPVKTKWTDSASRMSIKGDMIFCVRGSTTGRRVISDGDYCIGRGVCAIRANNGFNSFIYQTINFGLARLLGKTTGSVFPSLSAPDIKEFAVLNPPQIVLAEFQKLTGSLVNRVQANHHHIELLTSLRDTLLPRLISGQLRLPDAEAALAEVI